MQAGTFLAEANDATVIESKEGAISVGFHFVCDEGHGEINGFQGLIGKDGTVNQVGLKILKEAWPGWDGTDPYWFQDPQNLLGVKVSIVLDWEEYNGKQNLRVKYINNPDKPASGLPKSMDRASFMQRHGARMRAVAGGVAVKPSNPAIRPPSITKTPNTKTQPTGAVGASSVKEAWETLCSVRTGESEETINAEWTEVVDRVSGGKHTNDITPQEWFTIKNKFTPI